MGVPVVSLHGDSHAGRVGVSLLSAVGHAEWIGADAAGYRNVAHSLPQQATESRRALRQQFLQSPLTDGRAFARNVGEVWRALLAA